MYRGPTPTLIFSLPMNSDQISALHQSFAQKGELVLEKNLAECLLQDNTLQVTLTEQETLLFDEKQGMVEMQLRIGCGESKMASNIMQVSVGRILKDGCLV